VAGGPIIYGDAASRGHPLNRGLVGWWLGLPGQSAGPRLLDVSGNRNPGTLTNGPTWAAGPNPFGAVTLDGSDDYVGVPGFSRVLTAATFAAVINADTQTNYHGIVYSRGTSVTGMLFGTGGGVGYIWNNAGFNWADGGAITTGRWMLVAMTFTSAAATGYSYDFQTGVIDSGADTSGAPYGSTTIDALELGRDSFGGRNMDGRMAAAWVWDRALSADEFARLADQARRGYPDLLRRRTPVRAAFPAAPAGGNRRRRLIFSGAA
jgi:hypothetical protein